MPDITDEGSALAYIIENRGYAYTVGILHTLLQAFDPTGQELVSMARYIEGLSAGQAS